jgi:hypothetical protein
MHPEDFEGLLSGLRSIADYERGKRDGFVTHAPKSSAAKSLAPAA